MNAENNAVPDINGPLSSITQSVSHYVWEGLSVAFPPDLLWPSLLLTLLLATFLYWYRDGRGARGADGRERASGLWQFLFPKDVYSHDSARVDIGLWLVLRMLRPLWAVAVLAVVGPGAERLVIDGLILGFGATPAWEPSLAWMLLYSLVALLLYDFVFFLTHLSMHKFPALWALHKVHHSAEVLTPLTRHREHFLAAPIWAVGAAFSYGVAAGIFAYLFAGDITEATLMNIGVFTLLFGFNGTFRHYHVQFNYPVWLSKWLQSPAMHHIHHSCLPAHRDKNLAAVTSIYDRLFSTLYIPKVDEYTPWGLDEHEQAQTRSVWQNMLAPFLVWKRMVASAMPKRVRPEKPFARNPRN